MPLHHLLNRPRLAATALLLMLGGAVAGMMLANRAGDEERRPCYVKFAMVKEGCLFFLPAEKVAEGPIKPPVEIRCKTWDEAVMLNAIISTSASENQDLIAKAEDQRFSLLGMTEIQPMRISVRTTVAGKGSFEVQYYTITRVEMLTEDTREGEGER